MGNEEIASGLGQKFELWSEGLSWDERQLVGGLLGRLWGDDVRGYSADLEFTPSLLGNQLRDLLLNH
jgi:hypothetical protein